MPLARGVVVGVHGSSPGLLGDSRAADSVRGPFEPIHTQRLPTGRFRRGPYVVKPSQRLDYQRLASALVERGVCDQKQVQEAMHIAEQGHGSLPEVLVNSSTVSDWELSRLVAEIYALPFLTVDLVDPDPLARKGLDLQFLAQHGLVPLMRCNSVLTVSMPGMVSADVLGEMAAMTDLTILPVVGSVQTNRRWIEKVLTGEMKAALGESVEESNAGSNWDNLFDAADASIQSPGAEATSGTLDPDSIPAPLAKPAHAGEGRHAGAAEVLKGAVPLPPPPVF